VVGEGSAWSTPVTTSVYNLLGNATYYYRLAARNSYGTAYSNTWSFTTGNGGGYSVLLIFRTNNATSVYDTSAVLNGEVLPTIPKPLFGLSTAMQDRAQPLFLKPHLFRLLFGKGGLRGLHRTFQGTRYDYRAVARNIWNRLRRKVSFTASGNGSQTGSPIVSTGNATSVGKNASLLWANVNPQNSGATHLSCVYELFPPSIST
jgi:hypothetical protein